jgi:isoaspartyl peptidase/L-asparaginase-like protein (Ntn-hydrolase superfamily)
MIITDQPQQKDAPKSRKSRAVLAIHGGAGGTLPPYIPPSMEAAYREALRNSLIKGYSVLSAGGSALDAVCKSVQELEDDPLFNAAKGAVFTSAGTNECESSVMSVSPPHKATDSQAQLQRNRKCASAILVRNTRNPILLAKVLLEHANENPHAILSGKQAEELGWQLGCERVDSSYYYTRRRWLEHRRDLGLPDDSDPGRCSVERQDGQDVPEAPPSYYAISDTNATPSLEDSDRGEKETERSTTEEAVTPQSRQSLEVDLGTQQFTHWHLDYDARRQSESREDDDSMQSRRQSSNWRSDSFEDIPSPSRESSFSLYRHQASQSTSSLLAESLPAGTVGAVALDEQGNLAVATSTGGVTNKLPGRIGDTPTPGAGFWSEYWRVDSAPPLYKRMSMPIAAVKGEISHKEDEKNKKSKSDRNCRHLCDWAHYIFGMKKEQEEQHDEEDAIEQASNHKAKVNQKARDSMFDARVVSDRRDFRGVAVSGTGTGDYFLRSSFASLLVHRMRFLGESVDVAGRRAVAEMGEIGGVGGAICVDDGGQGESESDLTSA